MAEEKKIKLRESRPVGRVIVYCDNQQVYSNSEYTLAAQWAQRTYNLTDAQMFGIYDAYKADYDSI